MFDANKTVLFLSDLMFLNKRICFPRSNLQTTKKKLKKKSGISNFALLKWMEATICVFFQSKNFEA